MKVQTIARRIALGCCLFGAAQSALAATSSGTSSSTPTKSYSTSSLATVTPTTVSAASNGSYVYLSWPSVSGAYNYGVYRGTSSTFSWSSCVRVGSTYGTSYYDYSVTKGKTYYYWIASGSTTQWFIGNNKWKSVYVPTGDLETVTPTTVSAASSGSYVYLSWPSVSGAYNYGVYRGTSSTFSWSSCVRVGSTYGTSYSDYSVTKGKTYYYWIATGSTSKWYINASKWKSVYVPTGDLETVTPTTVSAASSGSYVYLSWPSVSGAYNYGVYRGTSSTFSWSSCVRVGSTYGTSYSDYSVTKGKTYYYWIATGSTSKWYINASKWKSVYVPNPTSTLIPPTPTVSLNSYTGYIKVTWPTVSGATGGYVVYRNTSSTFSWTGCQRMTTTSNAFYYDTDATPGVRYYYWIGPRNSQYTYVNSSRWSSGIRALDAPKPSASTSYSGYIKVTWSSVVGAKDYVVYRSTSSTFSWDNCERVITMHGTVCYDSTAPQGVNCYYWIGPRTDSYIYVNTSKSDCGMRTY